MQIYKKSDDEGIQMWDRIDRSTVLQETKVFAQNDVKARKCAIIITKLLYLIHQGQILSVQEATNVFFAMTRLFQLKDASLRRLLYLGIKELSFADHVMMVTSSLTKDISGKDDNYRAAALRALCEITDSTNLQSIERYIKQCIVDRNSSVSSAAIVCALRLFDKNSDVVKRWSNEVQGAINSKSNMVQYHALGLLYIIRKRDKLAIMKLVGSSTRGNVQIKSPYAMCLMIRYVSIILEEIDDPNEKRQFYDYLEYCLSDSNEMVMYEAACAICNLASVSSRELGLAVSALQLFLASPQPTLRFAAVRTLSKVAVKYPMAVATCNFDLEALISDPNKSIGVMAITTLLKTGNEASIDRLIGQIPPLILCINNDFKIVVIKAIGQLCMKFPGQQHIMLNFLSSILRDQGSYEYKLEVVNTLISIITSLPEARESGLMHLCEFIEDCDFPSLSARVLRLLGEMCPQMPHPSKYIKYIHNRVILEDSSVRAAAVSALAKFGVQVEELAQPVAVLLGRCKYDVDDEVRDRATFYLEIMKSNSAKLQKQLLKDDLLMSMNSLESNLLHYLETSDGSTPFDFNSVPVQSNITKKTSGSCQSPSMRINASSLQEIMSSASQSGPTKISQQDKYIKELSAISEFNAFGPLFKSSKRVMLTESETEYVVSCIKHTFRAHVVFQFTITNTITEYILKNVSVEMDCEDGSHNKVSVIPLKSLEYEQEASTYVAFELPEDSSIVDGRFTNVLKFLAVETDTEEGMDDEYELEDIEVSIADHIVPVSVADFNSAWNDLGENGYEVTEVYELSAMRSINEAVTSLIDILGMFPTDHSDTVQDGKSTHQLTLSGFYRGNHKCLIKARMAFQLSSGVTMQLSARSTDADTAQILVDSMT